MRGLFSIWVIIMIQSLAISAQNNLYIAGPNGQGVTSHEVLTGGSFQLDYTMAFPNVAECTAKITLSRNSSLGINDQNNISLQGTYNVTIDNPNNSIIVNVTKTSNTQNVKINGSLSGIGNICELQSINYSVKIQFFDLAGIPIGNEETSNTVTVIPKYNFTYYQNLQIQNNGTACKGGFVKYKIILPSRVIQGHYKLSNVKFTYRGNATLVAAMGQNGSWAITEINTSGACQKTFEFFYNGSQSNELTLQYQPSYIDLVLKSDCACHQNNQPLNIELITNGLDPCGRAVSFSKSTSFSFNNSCCNASGSGEVLVSKDLEDFDKPFCSGGCHDYYYMLKYSNENNSMQVSNLQIYDPIPDGIKLKWIDNGQYLINNSEIRYKLCYTTSTNTNEICLNVGSADRPYGQWSSLPDIKTLRWEFIDPIPAWYSIKIIFQLGFNILANYNYIADNIATFSSINPSFSVQDKVLHGTIPICPPDYDLSAAFIRGNGTIPSVLTFPSATEIYRVQLMNFGFGDNPSANISIKLPQDVLYNNILSYGYRIWPNINDISYQALPSNTSIEYNQSLNILTINNITIPSCGNQQIIFDIGIKVKNGAIAGPREVQSRIINRLGTQTNNITINDYYKINAKIYQRCKSGDLIPLENKVLASESLEYVYELENVGNESVDNITLFNHKPAVNDFTLNSPNQTSRNSEVSTNYSGQIYELNQIPVQAQYISSLNGNPICDATFGGNTIAQPENALMMIIKPQDPTFILGPGQKIQIVQKHNIGQGQSLNLSCNNDFSFCLRRINLNTPDNGISDQIRLTLSDATLCPKVVGCDEVANIETRFDDAFNVQVSGNQVTLTTQNLNSNDQWSLVWDDEQYFANESHWGNQTVSRTFPNNVTGQHKLCIKVKNHLEANNSQSQECKCELICKTFNLN